MATPNMAAPRIGPISARLMPQSSMSAGATKPMTARETAKRAYDAAVNFVRDFDRRSQNLFLYGSTGVGKTFLSHCIANALLESAHCVLYFSAFDLFDRLAQTAFSKKPETDMGDDFIFNCDLLIIDDLGTELTNSFVSSQLFFPDSKQLSDVETYWQRYPNPENIFRRKINDGTA